MSSSSENQERSSSSSSSSLPSFSVADDLRNLKNQLRAKIVSDTLKKGAIGVLVGTAFSLLIFKRKLAPIWFGLGLGLGMAYSDGSQLIKTSHNSILEKTLNHFESESQNQKPLSKILNLNISNENDKENPIIKSKSKTEKD